MNNATTKTLSGREAIEYAESRGLPLCSYDSPVDDGRDDLTPDEAREIAREDPSLIWIEVQSHPTKVARVIVPTDTRTSSGVRAAGTYLVEMPADYDPALVTAEDIDSDEMVSIIEHRLPRRPC